jgi:hypothetical protein
MRPSASSGAVGLAAVTRDESARAFSALIAFLDKPSFEGRTSLRGVIVDSQSLARVRPVPSADEEMWKCGGS